MSPRKIMLDARHVACPCGYSMLTFDPAGTARQHNKAKHESRFQIWDRVEQKAVPQRTPTKKKEPNDGAKA